MHDALHTMSKLTQSALLMEFFVQNANRNIQHPEVVDWATAEWRARTGSIFRDPDRGIRKLHQEGHLIKIKKGVYRYNPHIAQKNIPENFSAAQKAKILKRDGYKCVVCGRGKKEGIELCVDHIKPRYLGGKANIVNGQTLCAPHNIFKKNFQQTEVGKRLFIRLYKRAQESESNAIKEFCIDILRVYEAHDMDSHIPWNPE